MNRIWTRGNGRRKGRYTNRRRQRGRERRRHRHRQRRREQVRREIRERMGIERILIHRSIELAKGAGSRQRDAVPWGHCSETVERPFSTMEI